jgi:DNA replication protein DnaC
MDTDWRADRIAALIDARYRADLPVMATTNIAPARWPDAFDARTASRLQEMSTPYELLGVDRRSSAPAPQPRESSGTVVHEGLIHVGVQEA